MVEKFRKYGWRVNEGATFILKCLGLGKIKSMEKVKSFSYTFVMLGLIGAAVIASFFQEIGSAMSGVIVQLGWCEQDNSVCLLSNWALIAIGLVIFGIMLDLLLGSKRSEETRKSNVGKTSEPSRTILERFSFHLDERTKDITISGNGLGFLHEIKTAPPFLGLRHDTPIISKSDEQTLTEFFRAQTYMEKNRDAIRGGPYQIRHGDNRKLIAKKVYGDEKYEALVEERLTYPNGTWLELPYLNLNSPDHPEFIKRQISISGDNELVVSLLQSYHLVKDEAIPLLRMVYDAALKTLDEKEKGRIT
jgi:hypothetical protein